MEAGSGCRGLGSGSVLMFDALFSGMHGVGYNASGFGKRLRPGFDQGFDRVTTRATTPV